MALILNIDTSAENAHVSFAKNGEVLHVLTNASQKDHASFLQAAIEQLVKTSGIFLQQIDAVAVTAGPGSYTGLRVGMASAKGLCYALQKPFITINTLEALTVSAQQLYPEPEKDILFCPMMDARRMEVFTAIYKQGLSAILQPCAMVLNELSFEKELSANKILFFGSGSVKWNSLCNHQHAIFKNVQLLPQALSALSNTFFSQNNFASLAYSEPFYLKEFQA